MGQVDGTWAQQFPELFADQYVEYAGATVRATTDDPPAELVNRLHLVAATEDGAIALCRSVQGWRFLPGGTREPQESLPALLPASSARRPVPNCWTHRSSSPHSESAATASGLTAPTWRTRRLTGATRTVGWRSARRRKTRLTASRSSRSLLSLRTRRWAGWRGTTAPTLTSCGWPWRWDSSVTILRGGRVAAAQQSSKT